MRFLHIVLVVTGLLVLAACTDDAIDGAAESSEDQSPDTELAEDLEASTETIVPIELDDLVGQYVAEGPFTLFGVTREMVEDTGFVVRFDEDGRLGGSDSCSNINGEFSLDEQNQLEVVYGEQDDGPICEPFEWRRQSTALRRALSMNTSVELDGDVLVLTGSGVQIEFERDRRPLR